MNRQKGLLHEAGVLNPISLLLNSDVPLEQPAEQEEERRVILAELLGDLIWEELSNCLIQNCLVNSIPTNSSKLEQYIEVGLKSSESPEVGVPEQKVCLVDLE